MCPTFHNPIAALSIALTRVLHRIVDMEAAQGVAGLLKGKGDCIGSRDDQVANEPPAAQYRCAYAIPRLVNKS